MSCNLCKIYGEGIIFDEFLIIRGIHYMDRLV